MVKVDPTQVTNVNEKIAPQLTEDSTHNTVGQSIELTFADNLNWRQSITGLKLNGTVLNASDYSIKPGKITLNTSLFKEEGSYDIVVQATDYPDAEVQQIVVTNSTINLALNKPTLTSEKANKAGAFAVDGKLDTRWESDFSDPQFITVNLKSEFKISRVLLNWENAAAKNYTVEVSVDGQNWKTVYSTTRGHEGINDIKFAAENARFVKVNGTQRTTAYGYSLWELEVYGTPSGNMDAPDLTADTTLNVVGQPIDITFAEDPYWTKAINAVKVDGKTLSANKYSVTAGKITLNASVFPDVGSYEITVEATGYEKAVVQQIIVTNSTVNIALNKPTLTAPIRSKRAAKR